MSLSRIASTAVVLAAATSLCAEPAARSYRRTEKTFADSTAGDYASGEDLTVRRAAVEALGKFNGSVVVVESDSGRVLTMVNQKLALSDGYIPCSTIKLVTSLAALSEGLIEPSEKVWFEEQWFMTLVEGLAISNNVIFDHLGERLGFERVRRYARWLGLGERAGWDIPGEQVGLFPAEEHKAGVGRMTSFGDGISVTPLQLAALAGAFANGGTLYYLQHPATAEEAARLEPRVKRRLAIGRWLPEIEQGMRESVKRGTGRKARVAGLEVFGKTGTCSLYLRRARTQLGWFASYNRPTGGRRIAVVVMLRGGPMMFGPRAAEIAGDIYRSLGDQGYFSGGPGEFQAAAASSSP